MKIHEIRKKEEELFILVSVQTKASITDIDNSLDELESLAITAGATVVGRISQNLDRAHPRTYVGKGKLSEIQEYAENLEASGIVFDDELSPVQTKNLNDALKNFKVLDRSMLILDIFAARAMSSEGKIQVELAQLNYRLSHLSGSKGLILSRLGGGIGTRGPGEKQLETDRRHIQNAIDQLKRELVEIKKHRAVMRKSRKKSKLPIISLVGYTNAGKSTIMNYLTGENLLAEDKLFATLDTSSRQASLLGGTEIILNDTVGFIEKLPHHLIQAFRSTLEELDYSDILVHVLDISSGNRDNQMRVVYETIKDLKLLDYPILTVFNKSDLNIQRPIPIDKHARDTVSISAKTGEGINEFLVKLEKLINENRKIIKVLIPFEEGQLLKYIHGKSEIIEEKHEDNGYLIDLYADEEILNRLEKYIV